MAICGCVITCSEVANDSGLCDACELDWKLNGPCGLPYVPPVYDPTVLESTAKIDPVTDANIIEALKGKI
jgi:hypothetical protein